VKESNHIIDKVFLEVHTGILDEGEYIKNHISAFLENRLFPYFEKQFSIYDLSDRLLRFEKLRFEIEVSSWSDVEKLSLHVKSQLLDQLEAVRVLSASSGEGFGADWDSIPVESRDRLIEQSHEVLSFESNRENVFLFYLERGYLPWYGNENIVEEISESKTWNETLKSPRFFARLTAIFQHNEEALERFRLQFPVPMVLAYYFSLANIPEQERHKFIKLFVFLPTFISNCLLKVLILVTLKDNSERIKRASACIPGKIESSELNPRQLSEANKMWKTIYSGFIKGQLRVNNLPDKMLFHVFEPVSAKSEQILAEESEIDFKTRIKEQPYFEMPDEEVTTSCSGIILLHPFFYTFFERTKISTERGVLPVATANQAVQALRYLATGSENFFGGSMVLEKFICGLPLKFPLERESQLSDAIKEEAEHLLNEVIRQWPVLKNTSPDGLRQLFLQRQGKLVQTRDGFKLLVERKAQDVLLEKLHWNYSIVKFPWRNELLYVEW
jgi:hypothetical protein